MRILQLNNEYPPLGGGTATVTLEVSKRLGILNGIHSELVTSSGSGIFCSGHGESPSCIITRLPLRQKCFHHASIVDLLRFIVSALRYLTTRSKATSFDVSLAWCTVPAGFIAFVLHKLYGLPYVVRVSGPDIPGFEKRYQRIYPILRPILRQIWRSAGCVVCKCSEEATRVMQVLPEARIRIVPNGVDTDTYYPARTRSPGPRVRILCVARLVERKGQRLAIKALAAIRTLGVDAELMLVGDGDSLASYKEFAHACGVGEHVMFRGALSRAEMPDAYRDADIFLLPSFAESMSVAALEALASGLPLVVTQGGGADLFVEHGRNGFLIPYGDVEALTAAIHELANSSELRAQYASESRRKSGQFSWSATTQGLLNALREVSKS